MRLGRALGKGGEGAVYALVNAPHLVAKIYRKAPDAVKCEKLRGMTRRATAPLMRVAAWPMDLLYDESGAVAGFLMRKVSAREGIHELYSPKSRRQKFPTADFRFVVRVATNLARAFAQVHAIGSVIGDVNHGNALVGRDATVVLIDCDSIQVRDGSRIYSCDVGVPLFTPPELQGRPFRGLRRTANHDAFGLAVLIFHLLYLGRHPFAGRSESDDDPIELAIAKSRFVYGAARNSVGMAAPPGTLPLDTFGTRIAALFERSFARPDTATRASPTEWVDALQELERSLVGCAASRLHYHPHGRPCCWCEVESRAGIHSFGAEPPHAEPFDRARLEDIWDAIRAVPAPERPAPMPHLWQSTSVTTFRASTNLMRPARGRRSIFTSLGLACLGILLLIEKPSETWLAAVLLISTAVFSQINWIVDTWAIRKRTSAEGKLARAEARMENARQRWNHDCMGESFDRLLRDLDVARRQLLDRPKAPEREFLLARLYAGPAQLRARREEILLARAKWRPILDEAARELYLARRELL